MTITALLKNKREVENYESGYQCMSCKTAVLTILTRALKKCIWRSFVSIKYRVTV